MKLFKRTKENALKSPKTTKNGMWYGLLTIVIGALGTWIATKNPAMSEFILENMKEIVGGIILIAGLIIQRFAAKKDPV